MAITGGFPSVPIITTFTIITASCKTGVSRVVLGWVGMYIKEKLQNSGENLTILTILTEIVIIFSDTPCIMFYAMGYKLSS